MVDIPDSIRVKLVKIGNSIRMTIPKSIAWALSLKAGEYVEVNIIDGAIIVKREANPE